jgi:hypothetical protein
VLDDIARESEEATRSKMIDACARVEQHYLSVLAASKAAEDKKAPTPAQAFEITTKVIDDEVPIAIDLLEACYREVRPACEASVALTSAVLTQACPLTWVISIFHVVRSFIC